MTLENWSFVECKYLFLLLPVSKNYYWGHWKTIMKFQKLLQWNNIDHITPYNLHKCLAYEDGYQPIQHSK